jgi:hypothetical protein
MRLGSPSEAPVTNPGPRTLQRRGSLGPTTTLGGILTALLIQSLPPESCMGEEAKAGRMRFARHWLVRPRVVALRSTKRGYGRVALQLCPCASAAVHLHGPRHRGIRNAAPAGWRARWIWGSGLGSDGASAPRYSENCETQAQERQHRRFGDTDATAATGAASRTGTFDVHIIQADIVKAG